MTDSSPSEALQTAQKAVRERERDLAVLLIDRARRGQGTEDEIAAVAKLHAAMDWMSSERIAAVTYLSELGKLDALNERAT